MKRNWIIFLFVSICGYTAQAQNVGGIWLSGPGIVSEGTGIHAGETPVLSIEDSIVNVIATGGAGAGKVVFGNLKFRKLLNANSVSFFASAGKGTSMPSLVFKFYERKLNGSFTPSLTILLSNVIVSKYRISSPDNTNGSSVTSEEISLFYDKIQFIDNAGNGAQVQVSSHF